MSNISFADDAWSEYLYWQTQDKKTLKKINALLKEIQRNPFCKFSERIGKTVKSR